MIGRLDQRITIERKSRTDDGIGGQEIKWSPIDCDPSPFARVVTKGGDEASSGSKRAAREVAEFTIRNRRDLKSSDRILWDDRSWNITHVERLGSRVRYIKIIAHTGSIS